uniref:Uncharacterized protein n=1 Tax=Opuntia streptacantha TaxID=393608 RepID=A0A7C8YUX1_OPUST
MMPAMESKILSHPFSFQPAGKMTKALLPSLETESFKNFPAILLLDSSMKSLELSLIRLHQLADFDFLNLPQALNSQKTTGSGKKMENVLPLPCSETLRISPLLPTTLRSNRLLSTTTALAEPPIIAQECKNDRTNTTAGLTNPKG